MYETDASAKHRLLERIGTDAERSRALTKDFGNMFSQVGGKEQSVRDACSLKTKRRLYLFGSVRAITGRALARSDLLKQIKVAIYRGHSE